MIRERGSVSIVVAAGMGFALLLAGVTVDLTRIVVERGRTQAAADAAALAAAQELVIPSARGPEEAAYEYAVAGGTRLAACRCGDPGEVTVEVERDITLPFLAGSRTLRASARAVVGSPPGSEGLEPWFAARLGCLFAAVPGLTIVSGFRTTAKQARLHQEKPTLAAPPGHSMHERGLAADLGFPGLGARAAAHEAAGGCGLAFPVPGEPWHVESS